MMEGGEESRDEVNVKGRGGEGKIGRATTPKKKRAVVNGKTAISATSLANKECMSLSQ